MNGSSKKQNKKTCTFAKKYKNERIFLKLSGFCLTLLLPSCPVTPALCFTDSELSYICDLTSILVIIGSD